jgi:hypothetical protein
MPAPTWSATLLAAVKDGGNVVATVRFDGPGGATLTETTRGDDLDDVALAKWAKARCVAFTKRDAAHAKLSPGPITLPADV